MFVISKTIILVNYNMYNRSDNCIESLAITITVNAIHYTKYRQYLDAIKQTSIKWSNIIENIYKNLSQMSN